MSKLLFGFSNTIAIQFMCEWVSLSDIAKLDHAVCNAVLRSHYKRIVSSESALFDKIGDKDTESHHTVDNMNLFKWLNLRQISVSRCSVVSLNVHDLFSLYICDKVFLRMKELSLKAVCYVSYSGIQLISKKMPDLQSLSLVGCSFPMHKCPDTFTIDFPSLNELSISNSDFPPHIGELFQISCAATVTKLSLSSIKDASIDSTITPFIMQCGSLSELKLFNCKPISDELIISVCDHIAPRLVALNLNSGSFSNRDITDTALHHLAQHAPVLSRLSLSTCAVTDDGVVTLLRGCTVLSELNLPNCLKVTNVGFAPLSPVAGPKLSPKLQVLNLNNCSHLSDAGLLPLLSALPSLSTLNFSYLKKISDSLFAGLSPALCANITYLNLYKCSELTMVTVESIAIKCPVLRSLDIKYCSGIDVDIVAALYLLCGQCLRLVEVQFTVPEHSSSDSSSGVLLRVAQLRKRFPTVNLVC